MILNFPEFKVVEKYRDILKNIFIIDVKLSKFESYYDRTIFSKCHSNNGFKISKKEQKLILSYLNNPTVEKWNSIYKYNITPNKTLWDAWNTNKNNCNKIIKIDLNNNVNENWKSIPTSEELASGIVFLVNDEEIKLLNLKYRLSNELHNIETKYKKFIQKYAWLFSFKYVKIGFYLGRRQMKISLTLLTIVLSFNVYASEIISEKVKYSNLNYMTHNNTLILQTDYVEDKSLKLFESYDFSVESSPCTVLGDYYSKEDDSNTIYTIKVNDQDFKFMCRTVSGMEDYQRRLYLLGSTFDCISRPFDYSTSKIEDYRYLGSLCKKEEKIKYNVDYSYLALFHPTKYYQLLAKNW